MSNIKTILEEIASREGKDILDVTQDELDVYLRNKHGRKTRFDRIMEDLEKEGKVHNIEDSERNELFTSLRTVMDEHNHSEKIRESKTLELLNRLFLK
jgi:LytS/YehU family sensor histidine kinase